MKPASFILYCALVGFLLSCETSDHQGYKRLENSIHYRLEALGDEAYPVKEARFVSLECSLFHPEGRLIAVKSFRRVDVELKAFAPSVAKLLRQANEGDSLTFLGRASEMNLGQMFDARLFPTKDTLYKVSVLIAEAISEQRLRDELAEERVLKDLELKEQATLNRLLDSLGLDSDDQFGGIYFQTKISGKGSKVEMGQQIRVHYRALLPNGKVVDDTYATEPLEYEAGRPDQVLNGFATGISRMKEGGEAIFVIPSSQAFGSKGSSSGIVPPYTSVIYEVKLVQAGV